MKKVIPFKKEVIFKTKISEIVSISLEHTLSINDDMLKGEFIVSGDYKITERSETTDPFELKLPFEIMVDEKYDTSKAVIDIDDFYYEIINDNILSVNIDLLLDKLREKDDIIDLIDMTPKREILNIEKADNEKIQEANFTEELRKCEVDKEDDNLKPDEESKNVEKRDSQSIFSTFSDDDMYVSYNVYIVRDGDNIDKILEKYNITLEELNEYNDTSNIQIGDKLIIPTSNEGN